MSLLYDGGSWPLVVCLRRAIALSVLVLLSSLAWVFDGGAQSSTPPAGGAACVGAAGTATAATQSTPSAGQCVTITSHDIYFSPNLVTIPANTPVTIMLPNEGVTLHNFSITDHRNPDLPNLNIDVDINAGDTQSTEVNADPGAYYFYCNVPGHEAAGMFGYLQVEPDASISAESATVTPRAGS
jgi:nitrite reductase (NO-forming)